LILFCLAFDGNSQSAYTLTPSHKNEDCTLGALGLQLEGITANDTLTITWSSGEINSYSLNNKLAGLYTVNVKIKNKLDSTLAITIEKEPCKVFVANCFTPNGDNYKDVWLITNTEYFPNFELYVYNKWGQQVHSQKHNYTAWDGNWNGINTPDGTYYYVFYYDGGDKSKFLKGDVTIIR
jgi:gliding motility-associated-like protein